MVCKTSDMYLSIKEGQECEGRWYSRQSPCTKFLRATRRFSISLRDILPSTPKVARLPGDVPSSFSNVSIKKLNPVSSDNAND
jgi:hypothetical protein